MPLELQVAWIEAGSTIISALIGVSGLFLIVRSRQDISRLLNQIEAYYRHEEHLVRKILALETKNPEDSVSSGAIIHKKGRLRSESVQITSTRPSMTEKEVQILRKKYFIFD
jgi:hypothetical protein